MGNQALSEGRQDREAAIIEARQFVYDNSLGTLTTVNQSGTRHEGFPTGQIEYYSDSGEDDSSLLLIAVDMSSAFANINKGSPSSLVIRTGDSVGAVTPHSVAAHHRIVLYGYFEPTIPSKAAIDRFLYLHPDAKAWQPDRSGFHQARWMKFNITGIYYIGGFGDTHYIGPIPFEKYANAPLKKASSRYGIFSWF